MLLETPLMILVISNEYNHYITYLMSKLINIYTLYLVIVVRHVSCSLRIYFIIYKTIKPSSRDNEGYSL